MFGMGRSPFGYGTGGGLMAFLPFIAIAIVLIIVFAIIKGRRGSSASLILEEFNFDENGEDFLNIKGRASGFWNWVLSLFNKAPTTYFTCNKQELKYVESNIKYNIPLLNITCVSSGMLKSSVLLLVLGIIFIIVFFPIGIIMIIVWALNRKSMHFGIYIGENKPMVTITMKRGIINSLDMSKFEQAANMLKKTVLENNLK
jgi:ABC-type dipeptide/oligopeptide/nickel transport system permease component